MAKFEKFISQKYLPISEEEKQEFIKRISTLVEKYDKTLKFASMPKWSMNDFEFVFIFMTDKKRKFKNINKSRISFNGLGVRISKNAGYIENYDWFKQELIDETKPREDYESSPPFQYSATMWVMGTNFPYRCRVDHGMANTEMYQYGTEFNDIDFSSALRQLYDKELKPMEK